VAFTSRGIEKVNVPRLSSHQFDFEVRNESCRGGAKSRARARQIGGGSQRFTKKKKSLQSFNVSLPPR